MAPSQYDLSCWWDIKHKDNNKFVHTGMRILLIGMHFHAMSHNVPFSSFTNSSEVLIVYC